MTEGIRRCVGFLWTLIRVISASAVIGAGIGFLEGETVGRGWTRGEQMALAEGASSVGLVIAAIAGTAVYFVFNNKISLKIFFGIVTAVLATGAAVAFLTRNEMVTALSNVVMVVGAVVYLLVSVPSARPSNE
jgi:hypothetical protein